jgi:hypothetical protein
MTVLKSAMFAMILSATLGVSDKFHRSWSLQA